MNSVNLYTKDYSEIGFAEDLPREGLAPLEEKIKSLFTNLEVNNKKFVTENVRLERLVDDGILCSIKFTGENIPTIRFIPSRLFRGMDLDNPLQLSIFASRVNREWRRICWHSFKIHRPDIQPADKSSISKDSSSAAVSSSSAVASSSSAATTIKTIKTDDMAPLTEMVFADPNTLIYRRRLPKLTEQQNARCSTYRKQEAEQEKDKRKLEDFFDAKTKAVLSKEEKLLFRSECLPSSSLLKEKWKLSQEGIEDCFQFLPIIERVVYKDTEPKPVKSGKENTSEASEAETQTIVREEFFCSYSV